MKLASYNLENMFRRPVALNRRTSDANAPVLDAFGELQALFEQSSYQAHDKARIIELLAALGLKDTDESRWAFLRGSRGHLLTRHADGSVEVVANGRADWIGWLELK